MVLIKVRRAGSIGMFYDRWFDAVDFDDWLKRYGNEWEPGSGVRQVDNSKGKQLDGENLPESQK
jgi:hypothetical protein